ncbi:MAG: XdhC family protein [Hyphomicrobiaceae bacterium]
MERTVLGNVRRCIGERVPVALLTWLETGRQELYRKGERPESDEITSAIAEGFRTDTSRVIRINEDEIFVNIFNPPLRLVIVGAVHISQALIPMAKQAGYDVVVIDPRTAFASEERFANVPRDTRWPDEALAEFGLDARTALVALTHDPKIDDPALQLALASEAFYIGALGSKRTHAKRQARLAQAGIDHRIIDRINAPIGLDIGAIGPVEIALSILAEVTAAIRGKLETVQ